MLFELEKRKEPSRAMVYLTPVLAVVLTMLAGALVFSLVGYDGPAAVFDIFLGPLLDVGEWTDLGIKAAPGQALDTIVSLKKERLQLLSEIEILRANAYKNQSVLRENERVKRDYDKLRQKFLKMQKKIDQIIASEGPCFSFEFFPPRTDEGQRSLEEALSELRKDDPALRREFVDRMRLAASRSHPGCLLTSTAGQSLTSANSSTIERVCSCTS